MTARKPLVLSGALVELLQSGDVLQLLAAVAGAASLNIPHGTAPTSPVDGDMWTTSAGLYVRINGTTVGPLSAGGGGGSGAITLISEVVTSGTQASVTFSSIPATYRDLRLVVRGRGTGAVFSQNVLVQFNSDTGSNYNWCVHQNQGTTNIANQTLAASSAAVGLIGGASATANYAGGLEALIFDYRGTTFFKSAASYQGMQTAAATGSIVSGTYSAHWLSTAAINAVKVFLATGSFVDGSVVSLYGSL